MAVELLTEGMAVAAVARAIRSTGRTLYRFRAEFAAVCKRLHQQLVVGVCPRRVQADECWTKIRRGRFARPEAEAGHGAAWVWSAVDEDTGLLIAWHVGRRDMESARAFLLDLKTRCHGGFEFVTDGCFVYPRVVEELFVETPIHHVVLNTDQARSMRFSGYAHRRDGWTTNHVERQNLDMRMKLAAMRRSSNTFARSYATLEQSIAMYAMHYNFVREQKRFSGTPAMAAGIETRAWSVDELVGHLEATEEPIVRMAPEWTEERRVKQLATWERKRQARAKAV